ncbi:MULTISPECIES: 3D domain-containing protein [unclassified Clostridium]|uniref:3D domain-containing protein n=1 Tax=unclassified Clostridium TaxID=2614128 RepID=UPI000298175C|nr:MULTISPECIES: 3D domain-containing protein [unclassified Clostridium]EKQ58077.1 MAG: hypothetical protein A370_00267 [Clostridium sp. Maddingley MBC34-26]
MLKLKSIICLLSIITLFNDYNVSIVTPFNTLATDVVKDNSIRMIGENKLGLNENFIGIKCEEIKQQVKEIEETPKKSEPEWKDFTLTFYTSLDSENSSAGPVTCQGKPLSPGGVANNVMPLNTKIYLEGYGQVVVNDRGSDKYFGVDNRLDVFIEREPGESDRQYFKRVNNLGVQKVKGYILK